MLRIKRRIASSRCCSSANGTRPNGVGSLRDLILHFPARGRSASASLTASSSQTLGPSVSRPRVRRCILDSCVLDPHRGSLMCKLAGTLRRPALAHRGSLVQARWDPPSAWVRRCILDRCVLYRHWIRTWRTVRLSPHPLQVGGSPPVKSCGVGTNHGATTTSPKHNGKAYSGNIRIHHAQRKQRPSFLPLSE
ncbi:uncharacterized protein [Dermacentor albipictus]|uniref:uncharacterized protein isoform X1 n=1 Tax=Dermacentor albipictus TaxID=60249 RepID=UPI0038FD0182